LAKGEEGENGRESKGKRGEKGKGEKGREAALMVVIMSGREATDVIS